MNSALRILVLALAVGAVTAAGVAVTRMTPAASAQDRGDEGWLGVSLQDLDEDLRDALDLDGEATGAVVGRVVPDSPADDAGIRRLDLIVRIGGDAIRDVDAAIDRIRDTTEGDAVDVVLLRRGRERTVTVTLGSRDDARIRERRRVAIAPHPGVVVLPHDRHDLRVYGGDGHRIHVGHDDGGFLGVESMALNDQLAEYFGAADGGVLVTKVVEDSPAQKAGLAAGDVIVSVAGKETDTSDRLRRTIRRYDPEDDVEVVVLRKGERRTFTVTLGDARDFGGGFGDGDYEFGFDPDFRFDPDFDFRFDVPAAPYIHGWDDEDWQEGMRELRNSLRDIRETIRRELRETHRDEVRNGMDEVRRALDEARHEARRAADAAYYD